MDQGDLLDLEETEINGDVQAEDESEDEYDSDSD